MEKHNEIPIEEFDNDTQNIREEFLKKFPPKSKEGKTDKKEIKKGFLRWL